MDALTPPAAAPLGAPAVPPQADSDARLLALWLHGRPPETARAYRREAGAFLAALGPAGLRGATLGDLQAWLDGLAAGGLAPASRKRATAAAKSLLSFAQRIGYLPVNVGAVVKLPPVRDDLAARILDREAVTRLIALEPDPRDRALLRLLYVGGLRVSEAVALAPGAPTHPAAPVCRSKRSPRPLTDRQARVIVARAARRAGLPQAVSPHWMRHAHASHALDAGTGVHLVKETLGHASLATTSRYAHARPGDSSALRLGSD